MYDDYEDIKEEDEREIIEKYGNEEQKKAYGISAGFRQRWICRKRIGLEECGHEVYASSRPLPIRWTDGHVCYFQLAEKEKI